MRRRVFKIEISDDAENDLDNSYSYYFDESSKLADAFFQSIKISLENLKKSPLSFPLIHKNLRKYTVRKFPFVIYYQVEGFIIKVIAIFHTSRNPKIWDDRIE